MICHRAHVLGAWPLFMTMLFVLPALACGSASGGSDRKGLPEDVEMRAVDGAPSTLAATPDGLTTQRSRCPDGAVIKQIQVIMPDSDDRIVGLELGCSALELVEEDKELRVEFGDVEYLDFVGARSALGGSITLIDCRDTRVVTHIAARISSDASRRLLGIDVECTPLFLVGAGSDIEPTLGTTPIVKSVGSMGGDDTMSLSCADPLVDRRGAIATGISVHASNRELGALVARCRRPAIEF